MRARNIKPGYFESDELADCGLQAHFTFAGLWCVADKEGRLRDRPNRIKALVAPYYEFDMDDCLERLSNGGFITRYAIDGQRFIVINNWHKHQRPHHKEKASEIPPMNQAKDGASMDQDQANVDPSKTHLDALIPDTGSPDTGSPDTGSVNAPKSDKAKPQDIGEVSAYIAEKHYRVDPETWWDHYESNGWKVGRNPMKDWRASVRQWHRKNKEGEFSNARTKRSNNLTRGQDYDPNATSTM